MNYITHLRYLSSFKSFDIMFFLGAVNSRFRFSRPLYLHAGTPWNEQRHSGWHRPAGIKANDQGGTKAGGGDEAAIRLFVPHGMWDIIGFGVLAI